MTVHVLLNVLVSLIGLFLTIAILRRIDVQLYPDMFRNHTFIDESGHRYKYERIIVSNPYTPLQHETFEL